MPSFLGPPTFLLDVCEGANFNELAIFATLTGKQAFGKGRVGGSRPRGRSCRSVSSSRLLRIFVTPDEELLQDHGGRAHRDECVGQVEDRE